MALVCPTCKSPAAELRHTGDATGFYCTIHGHFKIANTVALDDYYTRAEWDVARGEAQGDGRGMACYMAMGFLWRAGELRKRATITI
jgi:hypothetical protein